MKKPDRFLSINELCERYGISRRTFYRMLNDPDSGLGELVIRVPPGTGRIRVPLKRFHQWLLEHQE